MKTKLESGSRANLFHYPRNSDISFLLLRSGKVVKGCAFESIAPTSERERERERERESTGKECSVHSEVKGKVGQG